MIISIGIGQTFDKNAIAHSFLKEVVLTCLLEHLGFFFFLNSSLKPEKVLLPLNFSLSRSPPTPYSLFLIPLQSSFWIGNPFCRFALEIWEVTELLREKPQRILTILFSPSSHPRMTTSWGPSSCSKMSCNCEHSHSALRDVTKQPT